MKTVNERQLYDLAVAVWGIEAQEGMLLEEIGEVLTAFNKRKRKVNGCGIRDYIEELVDLSIMIEQQKIILGVGAEWDAIKERKLKKLANLLKVKYETER